MQAMETMLEVGGSSGKHSFLLLIKETGGLEEEFNRFVMLREAGNHLSPPHLGCPTGGVCAHGAGHQHLWVHRLSLLQVIGDQVCQAVNENWVGVGCSTSRNPLGPDLST